MAKYRSQAQKKRLSFGQHFLVDQNVIRQTVHTFLENVKQLGCDTILEIGPGKGALTEPLLDALSRVPLIKKLYIIEKDRVLAAHWMKKAQELNSSSSFQIEVIEADFLHVDSTRWGARPVAALSNLPYSASIAIFQRLAACREVCSMVLMFQAEVAERIRSKPGAKSRGSLSVWSQNLFEVQKLLRVSPRAFRPPPKVYSETILVARRPSPKIPLTAKFPQEWDALLTAIFRQRRKMIRNVLKGTPFEAALEASGVTPTKRAQDLDWAEWEKLFFPNKTV